MTDLEFSSWLAPHFERHVALKRASGYVYKKQPRILLGFDRYLVERGATSPLTSRTVQDYLASLSRLERRSRDNVVCVVWQALEYAQHHGAHVEPLPQRPRTTRSWIRSREPFVLSLSQVERLLLAARESTTTRAFVRATHACLLGLLYTTGVRIGEALRLDVGDLDRREGTLFVRAGKFKKDRLLPLPSSTVAALVRYLEDPRRPRNGAPNAPFFVSRQRGRLSYIAAREMLLRAAQLAGLGAESDYRLRPHDLRHTFAVHRALAWYRTGRDVNALLPALSTYMGHVSPAHTYTYLRSAELLSSEVAKRFELSAERALRGGEA